MFGAQKRGLGGREEFVCDLCDWEHLGRECEERRGRPRKAREGRSGTESLETYSWEDNEATKETWKKKQAKKRRKTRNVQCKGRLTGCYRSSDRR